MLLRSISDLIDDVDEMLDTGDTALPAGPSDDGLDKPARIKHVDLAQARLRELLNLEEFAGLIGVSKREVERMVAQGAISTLKEGRRRLIPRTELDRFVKRKQIASKAR